MTLRALFHIRLFHHTKQKKKVQNKSNSATSPQHLTQNRFNQTLQLTVNNSV